ncbi:MULTISPECIES: phosphoribosyltransferase family protein [unclassified Gordonia (in: high G+C Gram-positive bacteria)]
MNSTTTSAGAVSWVGGQFGVEVHARSSPRSPWAIDDLIIVGLRRNRRRAHLLVSTVLGKHIPTPPSAVRAAADDLGDAVLAAVGADAASRATVLGFAETATGLGHCVAARISARAYLHSTRRRATGVPAWGTFEEGHSHATTHLLQPADADLLATDPDAPMILVDDEISTGSTALRAITALQHRAPRTHYVVASLVDMCTDAHRATIAAAAAELGVRIDQVSLAQARILLPDNIIDEVWALEPGALNPVGDHRGDVTTVHLPWPDGLPDGGRHGFLHSDEAAFGAAISVAAEQIGEVIDPSGDVVVVGHEELMYLPLCLAEALEVSGVSARYQTTTRSPAYVRDVDGYPLRRGFTFTAPESDPGTPRFVYNLVSPFSASGSEVLPQVVLVIDAPADTDLLRESGGVIDVLTAAGHDVIVAVVPTGGPKR